MVVSTALVLVVVGRMQHRFRRHHKKKKYLTTTCDGLRHTTPEHKPVYCLPLTIGIYLLSLLLYRKVRIGLSAPPDRYYRLAHLDALPLGHIIMRNIRRGAS